MNIKKPDLPKSFIRDSTGHVVLWQSPNIPLYGWIISKIVSSIASTGHIKTGFDQLSTAFLFAWALLELTQGVNYFRRILGFVILVTIVMSYFS